MAGRVRQWTPSHYIDVSVLDLVRLRVRERPRRFEHP